MDLIILFTLFGSAASLLQNPGFDFSGAELDKKYDNIPTDILRQYQLEGGNMTGEPAVVEQPID